MKPVNGLTARNSLIEKWPQSLAVRQVNLMSELVEMREVYLDTGGRKIFAVSKK